MSSDSAECDVGHRGIAPPACNFSCCLAAAEVFFNGGVRSNQQGGVLGPA